MGPREVPSSLTAIGRRRTRLLTSRVARREKNGMRGGRVRHTNYVRR